MKYQKLSLIFAGLFLACNVNTFAATDLSAQESFLKAKAMNHQDIDHSNHQTVDKDKDFHGVFYGFLPCDNCNGIKTTLSLKQNNYYLLVTQQAKESSREFFEKGKYIWDEENNVVTLTPRDANAQTKQYVIEEDGGVITLLNNDGKKFTGEQANRYILRRSDTVKSREVHIH